LTRKATAASAFFSSLDCAHAVVIANNRAINGMIFFMYDGLGVNGFKFTGGLVLSDVLAIEDLSIHGNIYAMG